MTDRAISAKPRAPRKRVKAPAAAEIKKAAAAAAGVEAQAKKAVVAVADDMAEAVETVEAVSSPAIESGVALAEATMADVVDEGPESMATVDMGSVDKAQAVFGDMQTRFKAAWDKSSKLGEEMVDFTKGNVEAVVASAKVAAKHGEEMSAEAAEYGKKSVESAMAMFKSIASAKSPTELFQLQSDYAKTSFDSAVAEASKVSEKILKIAGDVAQPISSRVALAAEKIKTTTTF